MQHKNHLFLIVLFVCCLFLPPAVFLTTPRQTYSATEKRKLAVQPHFPSDIKAFDQFTSQFEQYLQDHIGFRHAFIFLHNYVKAKIIGVSPLKNVLLGKKNWLFLDEDGLVADYRGLARPDRLQLEAIRIHLEKKRAFLKKRGIEYIYMIAPNKQSLYPEYMPSNIRKVTARTRLDDLADYLRTHSNVPVLDLRPVLRGRKSEGILYFRTDAHWNDLAAFSVYTELLKHLEDKFPELHALGMHQVRIAATVSDGLGTANMMALSSAYPETIPVVDVKAPHAVADDRLATLRLPPGTRPDHYVAMHNPSKKLNALVFRDSFFTSLIPFLSENFGRVVYVWTPFEEAIADTLIREVRPAVVIEETVERMIGNYYQPAVCYNLIGNDLLAKGKTDKAIAVFTSALSLDYNQPDSYNNLGFALMKNRRFDPAIAAFRKALSIAPRHVQARNNLETALSLVKSLDAEIQQTRNKIRINPESPDLYHLLGDLYRRRGKPDMALKILKNGLSLRPESPEMIHALAVLHFERKAYAQAEQYFRELTRLVPSRADAFYNLACIQAIRGDTVNALSSLKKAVEKGYGKWHMITSDPDLSNLRETQAYHDWIERENRIHE